MIGPFYDQVETCVWVESTHSQKFQLNWGVKQGSVLSPFVFLLVIDSLLVELESSRTGACINGIYVGSQGYADDHRCITANIALLEQQASVVKRFTQDNDLQLNMEIPATLFYRTRSCVLGCWGYYNLLLQQRHLPWGCMVTRPLANSEHLQ